MSDLAIRAEGLVKRYGDVVALDGLSLAVPKGSVLALLGPNGAGKTTAVRILTTLLQPDEGTVTVAGADLAADPNGIRERIGLSGQEAAVDEYLTGQENLEMVGRLYHLRRDQSKTRARELLEQFSLSDAADRPAKTYSGGMRRRLDLAAALVASPPVLFLDEPTTGLDPRSRFALWDFIAELVQNGTTVLLTTQYLEEAERLAHKIVVIDRGTSIAEGSADQLKDKVGGERVEVIAEDESDVPKIVDIVSDLGGDPPVIHGRNISLAVDTGPKALMETLRRLDEGGVEVHDVGLRRPTLDDVFLSLTGRSADEAEQNGTEAA